MVTRLRHVNPIQFALVTGLLYAFVGLIFAILWLPFASVMATLGAAGGARSFGAGLGVLALIVFPIGYFVMMFVFGLISAAIYNLVAGWTGGIEVTLEQTADAGAPAGGFSAT